MILFFLLALLLIASAIGVVAIRNPIFSALSLVFHLLVVAVVFASLSAHFLAAVQVIVYAGAIVVLVLFVLMLLNIQDEVKQRLSVPLLVFSGVFGLAFMYWFARLARDAFSVFPEPKVGIEGGVREIGLLLYSNYVFPFEAASVLIMAAIVGAVMLAKRRTN